MTTPSVLGYFLEETETAYALGLHHTGIIAEHGTDAYRYSKKVITVCLNEHASFKWIA